MEIRLFKLILVFLLLNNINRFYQHHVMASVLWHQYYSNGAHSSMGGHPIMNEFILTQRLALNITVDANPIFIGDDYVIPVRVDDGIIFEKYNFYDNKVWSSNFKFPIESINVTTVVGPNSTETTTNTHVQTSFKFSLATKGSRIFILYHDINRLISISADSGDYLWQSPNIAFSDCSYPQIIKDKLFVNCYQNSKSVIYHLKEEDGTLVNQLELDALSNRTTVAAFNKKMIHFNFDTGDAIAIGSLFFDDVNTMTETKNINDVNSTSKITAFGGSDTFTPCMTDDCFSFFSCSQNDSTMINTINYNEKERQDIRLDNGGCSKITDARVARNEHDQVFFFFNKMIENISYFSVGLINQGRASHIYTASNEKVLDIALSYRDESRSFLYVCTPRRLLMVSLSQTREDTTKEYGFGNDFYLSQCHIAAGTNQLLVYTTNATDGRTVVMRLGDAICKDPCSINSTGSFQCTEVGCDCMSHYYPRGLCNNYCQVGYSCVNGVCDDQGKCVCQSQWAGDKCEMCSKYYVGEKCNIHAAWVATISLVGVVILIATVILMAKFIKDKEEEIEEKLKYTEEYQGKILNMGDMNDED